MRYIYVTLLSIFCLSCSEQPQYSKITGSTMGTTYNVIVESSTKDAQLLYKDIETELAVINQLMSTYIPDSEINRFNALQTQQCFRFSSKTWTVLKAAQQIYYETNGAFDITLGPLISRWGFNVEEYDEKVPNAEEVKQLLQNVGTDKLQFDDNNRCISKSIPSLTINLSAIAKGYAVDQLASIIESHGIDNFLVEIGGETKTKGVNNAGTAWRIAVEKPVDITQKQMLIIGISDNSIATSGDYRNYFVANDKRFSHTIDPTTGYPVTHDLTSVTVIHPQNMYADAYATALTVMGSQQALDFAAKSELPIFLITRSGSDLDTAQSTFFEGFIIQQ